MELEEPDEAPMFGHGCVVVVVDPLDEGDSGCRVIGRCRTRHGEADAHAEAEGAACQGEGSERSPEFHIVCPFLVCVARLPDHAKPWSLPDLRGDCRAVLERVVGARVEEPLPDLWLALSAHRPIFHVTIGTSIVARR